MIQWDKKVYTEFSIREILRKQWMELVRDRLKLQENESHKDVQKSVSSNRMDRALCEYA